MVKKLGIFLLAVIGIAVIAEATYRRYRYNQLLSNYREYWFWSVESPLYVMDPDRGYRYKSESQLVARYFDENNNLLRSNPIHVNNFGHISSRDDSVEKPASEFRIAILGDSFTACTTNAVPWSDLLEVNLNKDEGLKKSLGIQRFKVINCGMDGTGIVQWTRVYDHDASRFKPDMVLVNFITGDISRKFIYRNSIRIESTTADYDITITCSSLPSTLENGDCSFARVIAVSPQLFNDKERTTQVKREIYGETVKSLPWLSPHFEILALRGLLRMKPRLQLGGQRLNPYFDTPDEAVSASVKALREIAAKHPRILIFHHPTVEELLQPARELPSMVRNLIAKGDGLRIETMLKYFPTPADQKEIRTWYIANDGHPSDQGCQLYSQAMAERLRNYFKGSQASP